MLRYINIIVIALVAVSSLKAEDDDLQDLLRKLYGRESFEKNRYIIGFDYGLLKSLNGSEYNLKEAWNTEIRYGFDRYFPTKDIDLLYYRQEMFVLGNSSTRFGIYEFEDGLSNEGWYGKIAIKDGYGYDTEYGRITLNHTTVVGWGVNDIEQPSYNQFLNDIDETVKPMAAYNSSLKLEWDNGLSVFGTLGERQFYNNSSFLGRTTSIAMEGALYILPDLAEDTLIDIFGSWYPWVHRSYCSTVSFLFYYMRQYDKGDWPFNSGEASTSMVLRLGLDYRFE